VVKNPSDNQPILEAVQLRMRALGIQHVTVQVEKTQPVISPFTAPKHPFILRPSLRGP